MKAFWQDLFYDMEECGLTEEDFALKGGEEIRAALDDIKDAIEAHDGKKALALIDEYKKYF